MCTVNCTEGGHSSICSTVSQYKRDGWTMGKSQLAGNDFWQFDRDFQSHEVGLGVKVGMEIVARPTIHKHLVCFALD